MSFLFAKKKEMDDWSFLFGFGAYSLVTLCRRTSWISADSRVAQYHDARRSPWIPFCFAMRMVYLLTYPPWVLSIWLFARTYSDVDSALYWISLAFIMAGLTFEKFWMLCAWELHLTGAALACSLSACATYASAAVFIGLDAAPAGGWQWIPALICCGCAALWYGVLSTNNQSK